MDSSYDPNTILGCRYIGAILWLMVEGVTSDWQDQGASGSAGSAGAATSQVVES
jgi:hypothetical protein